MNRQLSKKGLGVQSDQGEFRSYPSGSAVEPYAMTKALTCTLFGAPQIFLDAQAVTQQLTPKVSALLIYLAVTGRSHARDVLADLLWSELSNQQARNNLRYLLSDLRKVVGDYLLITPQSIGFNRQQPYWLDVEVLRTTLETKPTTVSTGTLQTTLDLYGGEFLAGFTVRNAPIFEAWVTNQRATLHNLVVQGLYQLGERYWQAQDYRAGVATIQRLLTLEPWHESGHRLQMLLLTHSGQRAAALAQFAACRQMLWDELGAEPESATTALAAQIRSGEYHRMINREEGRKTEDRRQEDRRQEGQKTEDRRQEGRRQEDRKTEDWSDQLATDVIAQPLPHNLPSQLTPFFGREPEISDLAAQLHKNDCRLITLVGEGGVGKTRLALAVAQTILDFSASESGCLLGAPLGAISDSEAMTQVNQKSKMALCAHFVNKNQKFPDGVWFVSLGDMTAAGDLADQLAVAVTQAGGWQFSGHQPHFIQLLTYLRTKALLLLFDNAEHLLPGIADLLVQLLQNCPRITILVTSRRVLNLQAEFVWRVTGLPLPSCDELAKLTPAGLLTYSSVALFVERVRRINRSFLLTTANGATVVAICRLVEGLPLAIELAAALINQYTCAEIYIALQRSYTILATTLGDLSPRHRSIKATLDHSWRLLTPLEAQVLAACAGLPGSLDLPAIAAATGTTPALVYKLVDQSLLRQVQDGAGHKRYVMHALVQQYAAEQVQSYTNERQLCLAAPRRQALLGAGNSVGVSFCTGGK